VQQRLGDLAGLAGGEIAAPSLDANRHRGASGPHQLAVAADLVADIDRLVKHHRVDGHRGAPAARSLHRQIAAGEIHLGQQPAAENVAVRVGVGRHRHDPHQGRGVRHHRRRLDIGRFPLWRHGFPRNRITAAPPRQTKRGRGG
jgi:hypothetical protein